MKPLLTLCVTMTAICSLAFADDDVVSGRPPLFGRAQAIATENGGLELVIRIAAFTPEFDMVTVLTKDPSVPGGTEQQMAAKFVPKTSELRWQMENPETKAPSQLGQPRVMDATGKQLTKQMILARLKSFAPVLVARDTGRIDDYYLACTGKNVLVLIPGPYDGPDNLFADGLTVKARDTVPKSIEE